MKMTAVSSASSSRTPPSSASTARNNNNNNNNNNKKDNQFYDRGIGGGGGGEDSSSCYYPGCRKDANCHCDICLHSFNSTRDLILNQSSSLLTKRKIVYPKMKKTSSSLSSSPYTPQSTPDSSLSFRSSPSPPPRPPQITKPNIIKKRDEDKGFPWGLILCKVVFVVAALMLLWAMDSGFLMLVSKNGGTKLTPDTVRGFVEEEDSVMQGDFKVKLGILQGKVEGVVGVGKVSNCSSKDSLWKLNQENFLSEYLLC